MPANFFRHRFDLVRFQKRSEREVDPTTDAYRTTGPYLPFDIGWFLESFGSNEFADTSGPSFIWSNSPAYKSFGVPHWFAVVILVAIATLPLSYRFTFGFSLRTLLIATTLVAVALGLIVWLR